MCSQNFVVLLAHELSKLVGLLAHQTAIVVRIETSKGLVALK